MPTATTFTKPIAPTTSPSQAFCLPALLCSIISFGKHRQQKNPRVTLKSHCKFSTSGSPCLTLLSHPSVHHSSSFETVHRHHTAAVLSPPWALHPRSLLSNHSVCQCIYVQCLLSEYSHLPHALRTSDTSITSSAHPSIPSPPSRARFIPCYVFPTLSKGVSCQS